MANDQNLIPFQPGNTASVGHGHPRGTPNRSTILNYFLFEFDPDNLVPDRRPAWWDKVKPKTIYEAATLAMGIQAMGGDTKAYNALNRALGIDIHAGGTVDVVHIFKPEKLSVDDFNAAGADLLAKTHEVVEGEVIDGAVESPAGTADISITNP
jgi:hypothetical protein